MIHMCRVLSWFT